MNTMPVIHDYTFGKMTVGDRTFARDLIIFPSGHIAGNWYRKQGHLLVRQDIDPLLETRPDRIVIGTGVYGRMQVDKALVTFFDRSGIKADIAASTDAVPIYNTHVQRNIKFGACFHLTC